MSTTTATRLDFIPRMDADSERWDREWIDYMTHSYARKYFYAGKRFSQQLESLRVNLESLDCDAVQSAVFDTEMGALDVFVPGDAIVDKKIFELGCGPGFFGKHAGFLAKEYLGVDYSRLALRIAALVSPENCSYHHVSEEDAILQHAGTVDTMVGRHFFIHQNFDNADWVLKLGTILVRTGGLISADFFMKTPELGPAIIHPAKSELDPNYASCAFEFSLEDIHELAENHGLGIREIVERPAIFRRFVLFDVL